MDSVSNDAGRGRDRCTLKLIDCRDARPPHGQAAIRVTSAVSEVAFQDESGRRGLELLYEVAACDAKLEVAIFSTENDVGASRLLPLATQAQVGIDGMIETEAMFWNSRLSFCSLHRVSNAENQVFLAAVDGLASL